MSTDPIHPSAIIDPGADIHPSVQVGPFCVIEGGVRIDEGTTLGPYCHIQGLAVIGKNNQIGTGVTIGHPPQHVAYDGAASGVRIGNDNKIFEYANIQRALKEGDFTTVGHECFLMGFTHIGHDCHVGNKVIMANNSMLAGHVEVGDRTFISGLSGAHQFCRVGRLVMVGGITKVIQDVPPFMIVDGTPAMLRALNSVGLKRAGFSVEVRGELKRVFRALYRSGKSPRVAIKELDIDSLCPEAREFVDFHLNSERGVTSFAPHRKGNAAG